MMKGLTEMWDAGPAGDGLAISKQQGEPLPIPGLQSVQMAHTLNARKKERKWSSIFIPAVPGR